MGRSDGRLPGLEEQLLAESNLARGLVRAAAEAPLMDERNEVQYAEIPCRTILNRCQSERVPFQWTINPYRGCEVGCSYCYARYTHEFLDLEHWLDFERRIFVKQGADHALEREIGRRVKPGEAIAIGTATDPYQPAERRYRLTRRLLEKLAGRSGHRLSVTTKSDLVLRDLDLLTRINARNHLTVNVTITTLDRRLARVLEPRAPTPERRLKAIQGLADAGLSVNLFLAPVLPRITDGEGEIEAVIGRAAEAGIRGVMAQLLFLNASSRRRYLPWLAEQFPHLQVCYARLYSGNDAWLEALEQALQVRIAGLRVRLGLTGRPPSGSEEPPLPGQQIRLPL